MVRRFASDRLEKEFKKKQEYEEKFAAYFLNLAGWGLQALETEQSVTALRMVQLELPNFVGAQRWFFETKRIDECLALSFALDPLLHRAGLWLTNVETASIERKAAEHKDPKTIAQSSTSLGIAYASIGNWDKAEALYQEALKIAREIGEKEGIARATYQLGIMEQRRGNLDGAEKLYQESLGIKKEMGDKLGTAITMGALGRLYEERDLIEYALMNFLMAAYLFNQVGSPYEEAALRDANRMVKRVTMERFKEMLKEETEEVRNYTKRRFPNL